MRRRVVGLVERTVLGAGMAVLAFAIERQLTAAIERRSDAAAHREAAHPHGHRLRIIGAAGARSWPWLLQRSRH